MKRIINWKSACNTINNFAPFSSGRRSLRPLIFSETFYRLYHLKFHLKAEATIFGDSLSETRITSRPDVRGLKLDSQSRCEHYNQPTDVIAIKMKCCGIYYACKDCHEALAGHAIIVWPKNEWSEKAVLCGACGAELTIAQYMESKFLCPACGAQFNPGCRSHYQYYFEMTDR
jgi:uncharacterized CHY-type Zn-finger protein